MYVVFEYDGVYYVMCRCPSCHKLTQVTGKKKPLKVRTCWACGYWFVEDCEDAE